MAARFRPPPDGMGTRIDCHFGSALVLTTLARCVVCTVRLTVPSGRVKLNCTGPPCSSPHHQNHPVEPKPTSTRSAFWPVRLNGPIPERVRTAVSPAPLPPVL